MNKKFTALLMALLLALTLCVPAMAVSEYGVIYDETDSLGSVELDYMGEHALPELSEKLQMDLRIDVFTDENVSADTDVMDIAEYVYENSGYGWGENRDGVSLTLLMRAQPDGTYALAEDDWSIYTFLSQTRGSAQDLADTVYDAVAPYMAERAWNGEDVTMSGTALIQATDAMMNAVTEYINANCPPSETEPDPEPAATPTTAVPNVPRTLKSESMSYVFDHSHMLTDTQRAELEAQAKEISLRHGCGVYVAFVDDFTEYGGGNDVYKTTYQLYHANELGMGENRDGIIILLSMNERNYAMFVYGKNAEYAFNKYGQEQLENAFLGYFGDNDWYGGASHYLDTCDEYLTLAEEGDPVRKNTLPMYLIVVAASCAISGFICLMLKWKMQTVHKKVEADEYVAAGGLTLTKQYDRYTHTTETRTKISSDSDSGGSTSSCSGGGGSGRSGTF